MLCALGALLVLTNQSQARDLDYRAFLRRTIDAGSTETLQDESHAVQVEKQPGLCRFLDAVSQTELGTFTLEGEGPVFTIAKGTHGGLPLRGILGIVPPLDVNSLSSAGSGKLTYSVKCDNGQTLELSYAYTVEKLADGAAITLLLEFVADYWGDGLLFPGQTTITDRSTLLVNSQGELVSLAKFAKLVSISKTSTPVAYSIINTTKTTTFEFELSIADGAPASPERK